MFDDPPADIGSQDPTQRYGLTVLLIWGMPLPFLRNTSSPMPTYLQPELKRDPQAKKAIISSPGIGESDSGLVQRCRI